MRKIVILLVVFLFFSVAYKVGSGMFLSLSQSTTVVDEWNLISENATVDQKKIDNIMKDNYKKVVELFADKNDVFEKIVTLLFDCEETSICVSLDRDNNMQLKVSVDSKTVMVEDIFDKSAQELFVDCFSQMSKICPGEVSILITKTSPKDNVMIFSDSVDFMFRINYGSQYVDYGIMYCESVTFSNYIEEIEDNWYWFNYWLV